MNSNFPQQQEESIIEERPEIGMSLSSTQRLYMRELNNEGNLRSGHILNNPFHNHNDAEFTVEKWETFGDDATIQVIVATGDVVLLLETRRNRFISQTSCVAYAQGGRKQKICVVEDDVSEMYYNHNDDSLITVRSVIEERGWQDGVKHYRTRRTTLQCIRRGQPQEGSAFVFQSDSDDITLIHIDIPNCRALTCDSREKLFKVHDLNDYRVLYRIPCHGLADECRPTKIIFQSGANFAMLTYGLGVPFEKMCYMAFEDGSYVKEIIFPAQDYTGRMIEHLIHCGERIILKLEERGIEIWDVSSTAPKVKRTDIHPRCEPILLPRTQQFLVLDGIVLRLFNLEGELLLSFDDHPADPYIITDRTYITRDEDLIVSSCLPDPSDERYKTINISSIRTGERLARLAPCNALHPNILSSVVFLNYDESTQDIFTLHASEEDEEEYVVKWAPHFHG